MKKFLTIILAVLLACGVFSLIACGGDGGKGKETGSITVTPASCEIDINQQLQLSAKFLDGAGNEIAGKAFTWESEDDAVATVTNEGLVTGIGVGNVKIFAKSGEISGYCDLTVIDSGEVPVLSYMGPDSVKLNIGDVYTLTAYVRYKNEDVAAQISFENSAPEIVSIATDGAKAELTAVDAGTAVITIKSAYNGVALSKEFTLQVLEKTVRQIDSRFIVDLSKDTVAVDVPTSDFLQEYDTTVSAITIGDGENVLSSIENGRATLIKSKLKAGEQTIKFETDRIVYEAQIKVCSKIITTEEEFKNIQSFYRATPVGNQLRWNGYVLLANDLDLQNEFETTESNVPFRVVESNSDAGLVGTFDGGGHTIKNFKVGVRGLFGAIGANGVVKDVSFIGVSTAADDGGIIAYFNYGSMSNVFVSASLTAMNPYGNGPGVLAHITSAETMFTRCVIEMTATPGAGKTDWGVIGHHTNMSQKLLEGTYSDIIVIGGTQVIPAGYTCSGLDSDTVKGYATLADYWADPNRNDASSWEGGMWQANSNQMPVLKTYGSNLLDNLTISPEAETEIKDGDVISTNRDSEVKFMLKTEVAGVSIDETTGVVTIDDDSATNGSTFTVVVYSRLDETVYTERQYTIKCLAATFATGKQVNVDLSENADYELSFATVTDGTHTLSGEIVEVRLGTTVLTKDTDYTISDGKITFKQSVLQNIGTGLKQVRVITEQENNLNAYTIDLLLCSKIIRTVKEFKNIESYFTKSAVGEQFRWDGYVLLANDLDLQNEFETTESNVPFRVVESNSDAGLVGTFDGGGHTIKNFKVGVRGLFGAIGANGVVKDVSFIGVSTAADDGGIIAYFNYGSMSNVFVSASLTAMNPYGNGPGVLAHITSAETMFTRCVIEMTATPGAGKTDWGVIGHHTNMSQKLLEGTYSDIIVIGGTQVIPAGYTCSGLDSDTVKGYATLADYWADPNRNDASSWEGGMWQANSNQMPVLKTYGSNLLDNLTISPEAETEIKDGDVISTNRDSEVNFMLKTEVAGVSIDETTGVVTIDDDRATNGSTFTVVVYSRLDETIYTERQYTIKCLAATFATGKQVNVDLSENADYELSFATVTDGTHTLSGEIVEVRLGTTVLTKDTDYTISDGKITFKQSVLQNIGTGLKQVRVITEQENNLNAYTIDLLLCSKIIRTVEEFKNIESYFTKSAVGEQFRWDGYVLLANDLDLQNGFETTESNVPFRVVNSDLNCGLMGTFDGGGHTVKNFTVGVRGLFGAIGANGVVKNVSFIGVSTAAGDGGIIAYFNNGTMQDIFVSASLPNDINAYGNGPGVLAHVVSAQTKFTRCVIEMTATPGADKTDWGVIGHHTNMSQKLLEGTYSDIIVIGGTQVIPAGYTCSGLDSDTVKGYATLADYWADPNRNDASSWEGGMWQATNGEMPALK